MQKRREDYVDAYGNTDPETGSVEFGRGAHAEARATYVEELDEIIDGLRAELDVMSTTSEDQGHQAMPGW